MPPGHLHPSPPPPPPPTHTPPINKSINGHLPPVENTTRIFALPAPPPPRPRAYFWCGRLPPSAYFPTHCLFAPPPPPRQTQG